MTTNISIVIQGMGYYFVEFCALYGYGDVLALLGRCQQELFMLIDCNLLVLNEFFLLTRSYAALRAADLEWIVGPGYSLGGYILEKNNEKP